MKGNHTDRPANATEAQWPSDLPFGVHIVASGLLPSPRGAVFALLDSFSDRLPTDGMGWSWAVVCNSSEVELHRIEHSNGGLLQRRIMLRYPKGSRDAEFERMIWRTNDCVGLWVFPELDNAEDARAAFVGASVGHCVIAGVQAPNADNAVARLAAMSVEADKLSDPCLFRRIDVMAQVIPRPLVVESTDCFGEPLTKHTPTRWGA
jgi:hypothetical protein